MELRHIGISLGDMRGLNDGLGEFALQLGQRLAAQATRWREQHGLALHFHLRPQLVGLFGPEVGYLPVTRWQRFHHSRGEGFALWHSLHQLNKTLPPRGAAVRMLTVHDLNYLYGRNRISTWRHHRRTQRLLQRTDRLTAISAHTAQDVRQHLGWTGEIQIIPNGASDLTRQPQTPLPGWQTPPQQPFLLHLSRMSPSKNPQAILALAASWPEMRFLMAGPANRHAQALRAENRLPNVEFHLGISNEAKAWAYAHCSGFLFPSWTEGFGLPPLEAMHFGKPVFLSRLTSLPEVGGSVAHYFDRFDPAAMRAVVQRGLALDASSPQVAQAVREHAARFSWDRAAQAYAAAYASALQLPPGTL